VFGQFGQFMSAKFGTLLALCSRRVFALFVLYVQFVFVLSVAVYVV